MCIDDDQTLPDQTVCQPRGFIFLVGCAVHRIFSADSTSSCRARGGHQADGEGRSSRGA